MRIFFKLIKYTFLIGLLLYFLFLFTINMFYLYNTPKLIKKLNINNESYNIMKYIFCFNGCYLLLNCDVSDIGKEGCYPDYSNYLLDNMNKINDIYEKNSILYILIPKNTSLKGNFGINKLNEVIPKKIETEDGTIEEYYEYTENRNNIKMVVKYI